MKELALTDGDKLIRSEEYYASISQANLPAATKWLKEKGYADLIKTAFTIPVDRGDEVLAERIRKSLVKAKIANPSVFHQSQRGSRL